MSKCVYCTQRKGKRPCPALGGLICSQCCGEHRMSRIACPSDCVYLDVSSDYQQKRVGERFALQRKDFYKELYELGGEKAAALFNLIEVVTFSYFHGRRNAQDGEVIASIQSLRRTLSPLHIPAAPPPVFADLLKKEYEAFSKQQGQGQSAQQTIDQQAAMDVLDRALKFVSEFSGEGLQSQRFLTGLIGYIRIHHPEVAEQLTQRAEEGGRIVLPGEFTPGKVEPVGHSHPGPQHTHHHTHRH